MATLPQLRTLSVRQSVSTALRDALLSGQFRPGQSLSEVSLASEMNVSRGPVREALLMLVQEGLVTHSHNYGFSVLEWTEQDLREVQQVRLPLEVLALTLAREQITAREIEELEHGKEQIMRAFRQSDIRSCSQADLAFHSLVWERSGNQRLQASLRGLLAPYFAYGSAFNISRPDLTAELLDQQHAAYVAFLAGTTARTAEECVRLHAGL